MRKNVYKLIREKIIHLEFKPGDPLNEKKLAAKFEVSRTPVREALHRLSVEGLVTITPNLGARVADMNFRDFRELIELRLILERGAAHLAAKNADDGHVRSLERLYDQIKSNPTTDLNQLNDYDFEFHRIIQSAAGNKLLKKQMDIVQIKFSWVMRLNAYRPKMFIRKLPQIAEAMKQKNAALLEQLLVDHVEFFVENLKKETWEIF